MPKAKSKATLLVADGAGGMVQVQDRRFQAGNWPVSFEVPQEQADTWLRYLQAACERRDWSSSSTAQMEARQNSGSITLNNGAPGKPQIAVVWERNRNGPLTVQARHVGGLAMAEADVKALFDEINDHSQRRVTQRVYHRGQLEYEGLLFLGELWLDDTLRLGPPTMQYDRWLIGPRVFIVDQCVDVIARSDWPWLANERLQQLAAFLSVVTTTARVPKQGKVWTFDVGPTGVVSDCSVRNLGYWETNSPQQMPARGTDRPVPLYPVNRPDFALRGFDDKERTLPADIVELWTRYQALPDDRRRQFLQAAAKWQEAMIHWSERSTLSYALMVVACEALKPWEPEFRRHNIYDVIEALLGRTYIDQLRQSEFRPQVVRGAHLHLGEFHGSEFIMTTMMSSYQDPSFDEARRALARVTRAAIIEWLRRSGTFTLPTLRRRETWGRVLTKQIDVFKSVMAILRGQ